MRRAAPRRGFPQKRKRRRGGGLRSSWMHGKWGKRISRSAARGGDLLFAEECTARGAEAWLFLPRPVEAFLTESVRLPGTRWEERFHALCAQPRVRRFFQHEHLGKGADELDVHARNNLWIIEAARALAPSPDAIYALLVWDEKPTGDGPGGTS